MQKITVIIPAYNEEKTVAQVLRKVQAIDLGPLKKEIIIVDDGSTDQTFNEIRSVAKEISSFYPIRHKKNKGKGSAVVSGIKKATGDIIVIQDADFEYDPNDIPRLIKPILDNNAMVVYGTRLKVKPVFFGKNRTPHLHHFFGNKFLSLVTSILYGYSVSDMETGYKAMKREVLSGIRLYSRSFDFEPEITAKILKKKIRIYEIPIKTKPRSYDEGKKIHWAKDGFQALFTLIKYKFSS
jgi:dolichol-phosphate mannosyltransferase